jgi:hypothetical protein
LDESLQCPWTDSDSDEEEKPQNTKMTAAQMKQARNRFARYAASAYKKDGSSDDEYDEDEDEDEDEGYENGARGGGRRGGSAASAEPVSMSDGVQNFLDMQVQCM